MSSENNDVLLPFEKRMEHYEIALKILRIIKEKETVDNTLLYSGFCHVFSYILNKENDSYYDERQAILKANLCDLYPELSDYEPKQKFNIYYWFSPTDYDSRINILETILHRYSSTVKKISNE